MIKELFGMAGELCNGRIYFSCQFDNTLYEYDLKKSELHFKKYFFKEEPGWALFGKAYQYECKIFFIPWEAKHIAIYDVRTDAVTYIDTPNSLMKYESIRIGNYIYLIEINGSLIYRLDMKNEVVEYYYSLKNEWVGQKRLRCSVNNNEIVFLPGKSNIQFFFNTETKEIRQKKQEFQTEKYSFYLNWKNKKIYIPFYIDEGIIIQDEDETFEEIVIGKEKKRVGSVVNLLSEHELLILPTYGYKLYKIDLLTKVVTSENLKDTYNLPDDIGFQNYIYYGDYYYIFSDRTPIILKVGLADFKDISVIKLEYNDTDNQSRIKEVIEYGNQVPVHERTRKIMYEGQYKLEQLLLEIYAN